MTRVTFCAYDKPGNVGGPVTWLQQLLPALRERGVECRCLFLLHFGASGPSVDSLRADGFECETFAAQETEPRIRWILERLKANPPDVFVPNFVVAALFAGAWLKRAGIPTIGILHSDDEFYRAVQDEFVFGPQRHRVSSIVCVSAQLAAEVRSRHPRGVDVRQVPYGVMLPQELPARDTGAGIRMAYVGRLAEEQKQIGALTRALCATVAAVPGAVASIFGDGPDRNKVEKIIADSAMSHAVTLEGNIPASMVQTRLLDFDVIVLLSDYEGLPIALLEGMASGCIPICRRMRSGIPELVEDGVTGLLIDGSPESLIDAARRLQSDRHLRMKLSGAARKLVENRFSLDASADAWEKTLSDLKPWQPIRVIPQPLRLRLPRRNPAFGAGDLRSHVVPAYLRIVRRGRMLAGRVRRIVTTAIR